MNSEYDIFLKQVCFSYNRQASTLENVDLAIERNDFASIVGPNGGGKTTLLKLILGLILPDSGQVQVFGKSPEQVRHKIGYMPQYALLDMDFPATVLDVVLMGRIQKTAFWFSKTDRAKAQEAIEMVDLAGFGKTGFSELSGGQKQRVLIARALSSDPSILILDEPTANVDNQTENALFELLQQLNKKMTILLVSHDLGFVSQYVRSVICVNKKVVIHPTTELEGGVLIKDIYNGDFKMIRHDHRCSEKGHIHD